MPCSPGAISRLLDLNFFVVAKDLAADGEPGGRGIDRHYAHRLLVPIPFKLPERGHLRKVKAKTNPKLSKVGLGGK